MTKEMEFFIYLMEHYSIYKGKPTNEIVEELKILNLFEEVYNRYEFYHIERLQNAFLDIDKLINEKKCK